MGSFSSSLSKSPTGSDIVKSDFQRLPQTVRQALSAFTWNGTVKLMILCQQNIYKTIVFFSLEIWYNAGILMDLSIPFPFRRIWFRNKSCWTSILL